MSDDNATTTTTTPVLSGQTYDVLKYIAQIILPALGALYFALAALWNFPHPTEVIGTITAVDVFLGIVLGISSNAYNKGDKDGALVIDTVNPEKDTYSYEVKTPLHELKDKSTITLKVKKNGH